MVLFRSAFWTERFLLKKSVLRDLRAEAAIPHPIICVHPRPFAALSLPPSHECDTLANGGTVNLQHIPDPPRKTYRIGAVGAGFIMRDIQLVAYRNAGFEIAAITSIPTSEAQKAADLRGIPRVCANLNELLDDPGIEIIDIAVPPHFQLDIVRQIIVRKHVRGILAQKPLAVSYKQAVETVRICERAGIKLAVNQNMRYDQSIRALKTLLTRGDLGRPVLATIEMRAIPHWQTWLQDYDRLTLLNMSIHHLDCFRFLFGDPESIYLSVARDPRTAFAHRDGIALYILEYADGMRASSWDDVWAGPAREGAAGDLYIKWRVEGTDGMAQGTIGWPHYPNAVPSTIQFTSKSATPHMSAPQWKEVWFPDAFSGPMGELMDSITMDREPVIGGRDNLQTMALVEAGYRSLEQHRPVAINEITGAEA
jgi:predicted dehydrogenase